MTITIVSGCIAYLLAVFWPFFPGRKAMVAGQAGAGLSFAVYHFANGTLTGAGISLIFCLQAVLAFPENRNLVVRTLYISTLPAALAVMLVTWEGAVSIAAAAAIFFATLSRWQTDTRRMRALFVLTVLSWLTYNLTGQAWIAACTDATSLGALLFSLYRERRLYGTTTTPPAAHPATSKTQV